MMRQVGSGPYDAASASVLALMTACAVFFACARCPIFATPNQSHSVELGGCAVAGPYACSCCFTNLICKRTHKAESVLCEHANDEACWLMEHANDEASWLRAL